MEKLIGFLLSAILTLAAIAVGGTYLFHQHIQVEANSAAIKADGDGDPALVADASTCMLGAQFGVVDETTCREMTRDAAGDTVEIAHGVVARMRAQADALQRWGDSTKVSADVSTADVGSRFFGVEAYAFAAVDAAQAAVDAVSAAPAFTKFPDWAGSMTTAAWQAEIRSRMVWPLRD